MEVEFRRTGERRYAVRIFRAGHPTIEMNPAPGYDPVMPHDLLHLIVEKGIGLRRGIYGQIAAGGNAGTFHPVPSETGSTRDEARTRRRAAKRGEKLLRDGRDDSELSERAAAICFREWLSRSKNATRGKLAAEYAAQAKQTAEEKDSLLTDRMLDRICASLDDASARWASLQVGESLTVTWPDRTASTHPRHPLNAAR